MSNVTAVRDADELSLFKGVKSVGTDVLGAHRITSWRRKLTVDPNLHILESLVTFTPALCKLILEHVHPLNRNLTSSALDRMVNLLRDGKWMPDLPDSTIVFGAPDFPHDYKGSYGFDYALKNGQHRLSACVKTGISFTSRVEIGYDASIMPHLDQHGARTIAQQSKVLNRPANETKSYAGIQMCWQIQNEQTNFPFERAHVFYLIDEVYPKHILDVPSSLVEGQFLVAQIRGTLMYLSIYFPKEVAEFCRRIKHTDFEPDVGSAMPGTKLLYRYLTMPKSDYVKERQTYQGRWSMVRRTFKAFDLFLNDKKLTKLRSATDSARAIKTKIDPNYKYKPGFEFDPASGSDE